MKTCIDCHKKATGHEPDTCYRTIARCDTCKKIGTWWSCTCNNLPMLELVDIAA